MKNQGSSHSANSFTKGSILKQRSPSMISTKFVQFGQAKFAEEEEDQSHKDSIPDGTANYFLRHFQQVENESETTKTFNKVTSLVYASVLTHCMDELEIMAEMNNLPYIEMNLNLVPASERFGHETQDDDILYNEWEQVMIKKFKRDVWYLHKALKLTVDSLLAKGEFEILSTVVQNHKHTVEEEETLLSAKTFSQKELINVRHFAEKQKKVIVEELREITQKLGNTKDYYNDLYTELHVKRSFVVNYEKSRREQNSMVLTSQQNEFIQQTEEHHHLSGTEDRIHEEMRGYMELTEKEHKEEILQWMEKYETDMEKLENATYETSVQIEKKKFEHEMLKNEYERRAQAIEDYLAHKRKKKREARELERRTHAATVIQAWWRGVMFRRHLGPYRRRKKGRKGSAKKRPGSGKNTPKSGRKKR